MPSTDIEEHESDLIMEARIPYCLTCYAHAGMKVAWWRIVAILVALTFFASIVGSILSRSMHLAAIDLPVLAVAISIIYVLWEIFQIRRAMKPSCTTARDHVIFLHPTSSRMSTIRFSNTKVADDFSNLNRYNLIQL